MAWSEGVIQGRAAGNEKDCLRFLASFAFFKGLGFFSGLAFLSLNFLLRLKGRPLGWHPARTLPLSPENIFPAAVVPAVYFIAEGVLS
jgi:hypothetical protein